MVRLCAMDQSTLAFSIILPNQSRRAEFQPAVGRACFFSISSVGFAAEVPSAGLGWAIIQGGQLSRLAAAGWHARGESGMGSAEGSGWREREHVREQGPRGSLYVGMLSMPPERLCVSFEEG